MLKLYHVMSKLFRIYNVSRHNSALLIDKELFNKYFTRKHYWLSLFLYNFLCEPETSFSLQTGYFRAKKIRYQSMHNILIWKYRSETAKLRGKRTHITCLLLQWCYDVLSLLWRHIWFDCMMLWGHLSIMTTDRN